MDIVSSISGLVEQLASVGVHEQAQKGAPGQVTREFFAQRGMKTDWAALALDLENAFAAAHMAGAHVAAVECSYDLLAGPKVTLRFGTGQRTLLFPRIAHAQFSVSLNSYVKQWEGASFVARAECLGGLSGAFVVVASPASTTSETRLTTIK